MEGVRFLDGNILKSKKIISFDNFLDTEILISSTTAKRWVSKIYMKKQEKDKNLIYYKLNMSGFKGGHSGIDIWDKKRGNPIKIVADILNEFQSISISEIKGGSSENVIPRDINVVFAIEENERDILENMESKFEDLKKVYGNIVIYLNELEDEEKEQVRTYSKEDSKNRMGNREMILRFFAYKDLSYNNNTSVGTSQALDYYSAKSVYFDESKVKNLKLYIENTLDLVKKLFGEQAFNKNNGTKSEKMIFDTVMLACSMCIDKEVCLNGDMDIENNVQLKNDFLESNRDLFNGKYTSFSKVLERQEAFYNFLNSEIINGTSN